MDAACRVTGRRRVVRGARFALRRASLDLPNDPRRNGEYRLQQWLLEALPAAAPVTVLDVGANLGQWSSALLARAERFGRRVRLHAFEPAPQAYARLVAALPAVRVNRQAVSETPGEFPFYLAAPTAGTNSLHPPIGSPSMATNRVSVTTVDDYLREHRIDRVQLMKVDAEGHDAPVLRGARESFAAGIIRMAQFEYNHRWVQARRYLKDVFDLLTPMGYQIGKLTPRGIEVYPGWDPELETFIEGNYVACDAELAGRLPQLSWWKRPVR